MFDRTDPTNLTGELRSLIAAQRWIRAFGLKLPAHLAHHLHTSYLRWRQAHRPQIHENQQLSRANVLLRVEWLEHMDEPVLEPTGEPCACVEKHPLPSWALSRCGPIKRTPPLESQPGWVTAHAFDMWAWHLPDNIPHRASHAAALIVARMKQRSGGLSLRNLVCMDAARAKEHVHVDAPWVSLEGYSSWADAWSFGAEHIIFGKPPRLGSFYLQPILGGFDAAVYRTR